MIVRNDAQEAAGVREDSDSRTPVGHEAVALANHVYIAAHAARVVCLDLHANRYLFAAGTLGRDLLALAGRARVDRSELQPATCDLLVRAGWLSARIARAVLAAPVRPTHEITTFNLVQSSLSSAAGALAACARADVKLRLSTLHSIVQLRILDASVDLQACNPAADHVQGFLDEFQASRLLYPRSPSCLFDCYALSLYLRGQHVRPLWIFGIRAAPFSAHCWLQLGGTVINDTVERVSRFTPIMAC